MRPHSAGRSLNGKTTLRWGGKLRSHYIGRRWGGEPITMVCVDNHVDIKITFTGAQIAAYTLTEEKIYYNKKDNELNPQRGNQKLKVSRHRPERCLETSHGAPEWIRTTDTGFRRAVLYPLSYWGGVACATWLIIAVGQERPEMA